MSNKELQKYTAASKYARYLPDQRRRETWEESVARVREMMEKRFPRLDEYIIPVYEAMERMDVLGSQRVLQYAGEPVLRHNARSYNCCSSHLDRLRFFQECFYLLLCGCGTGFSVQRRHTQHLPRFSQARLNGRCLPTKIWTVQDSIQGWADTVGVLLSSYHEIPIPEFADYHDCEVEFRYDKVRQKGASLSSGIGRAPGPDPLRKAVEKNRSLLERALEEGLVRLSPLFATDIVMHNADAVISGGVRRSATSAIFDVNDEEMASAKTGSWFIDNPQRGRANFSATLLRSEVTFEQFSALFKHTKEFGEPGIWWTNDLDIVPNPCFEIGMLPLLYVDSVDGFPHYQGPIVREDGRKALSGWQMCNLTTINGSTVRNEEDFYERCRHAAVMGTLQASFTSFPYLGRVSEKVTEKESLLGVSIAGMMQKPGLLLDPQVQRNGAEIVLRTNERLAPLVGVNPCARGTTIKPDGNSAALLGSYSGVHAGKFRRGFRTVQANRMEAPYQFFSSVNPQACEPSVWSANGTDDVIRFPMDYGEEALTEDDLTAMQQLDNVKTTFLNWVASGRVLERCVSPALQHNVSNTLRVRDHEWDEVCRRLYEEREFLGGISLLAWSGDRDYAQAPFTAVYTPEEQVATYGQEAVEQGYSLAENHPGFRDLWEASAFVLGYWGDRAGESIHEEWKRKVVEYALAHHGGDLRRATYCLKDIHNWKLYRLIKETFSPVDYGKMVEEEDGTVHQMESACAGGACEPNIPKMS